MIGLYCLAVISALVGAKFQCEKEYKDTKDIPLRIREMFLDQESDRLDKEIERLLQEHRTLCKGAKKRVDQSLLVTDELQDRFDELERKMRR